MRDFCGWTTAARPARRGLPSNVLLMLSSAFQLRLAVAQPETDEPRRLIA
jgi:hypothetical protein